MVCNEVQWSATSCNNRAKRIVLSTKKALVVGGESRSQLFCKKITHYQTFPSTPSYYHLSSYRSSFKIWQRESSLLRKQFVRSSSHSLSKGN